MIITIILYKIFCRITDTENAQVNLAKFRDDLLTENAALKMELKKLKDQAAERAPLLERLENEVKARSKLILHFKFVYSKNFNFLFFVRNFR